MPNVSVIFPEDLLGRLREATSARGFKDQSEFIRHAVMNEIQAPDARYTLTKTYELLNCLAKFLFHLLPEPPEELKAPMKEQGTRLYAQLLAKVSANLNHYATTRPTDNGPRGTVPDSAAEASAGA